MSAISIIDLKKRFPRTSGYKDLVPFRERKWITAVKGVNLDIAEGEFFGLLGPNGAGKTTLIKMLCCLVLPDSGEARIFEHNVSREEQKVKEMVGLVSSEERSFFWRITGRENLQFFASLYKIPRKQINKRIEELLHLVGLADDGDTRFQNYSTGMKQKLAIARGLLSDPRVLFVDEPTRSLDPVSAQAVRLFLKEKVAGAGKTVVLATHNLREAEELCDRLAIMDHGRVIALGSVEELRSVFQQHEGCELRVRNLPETVVTKLNLIEGIVNCRITDIRNGVSSLEFGMVDREKVLSQVLEAVVNSGAVISNCRIRGLELEEIFDHALRTGGMEEDN